MGWDVLKCVCAYVCVCVCVCVERVGSEASGYAGVVTCGAGWKQTTNMRRFKVKKK